MFQQNTTNPPGKKFTLSMNYSFICVLLLVVIGVMLFFWKPWSHTTAVTRKISVTGTATIKAVPDEYQLSPYFEFDNADRAKNTADATAMGSQVTAKLKELGVKDTQIKSSTNSYDKFIGYSPSSDATTASLQLAYTITLGSKDTAQKVQDYFLGLNAKGQISPQATFSEAKSKILQAQAQSKAVEDAKAKGEKTASEVGAKLGKVITIKNDGSGDTNPCGYGGLCMGASLATSDAKAESIPVQSGENEFSSSVLVEYELR